MEWRIRKQNSNGVNILCTRPFWSPRFSFLWCRSQLSMRSCLFFSFLFGFFHFLSSTYLFKLLERVSYYTEYNTIILRLCFDYPSWWALRVLGNFNGLRLKKPCLYKLGWTVTKKIALLSPDSVAFVTLIFKVEKHFLFAAIMS